MTKAELVEKIHAKAGLSTKAKAEEALDAVVAARPDLPHAAAVATLFHKIENMHKRSRVNGIGHPDPLRSRRRAVRALRNPRPGCAHLLN